MTNNENLLYDLGLIDINFHGGITPVFMENEEVFKIPITEENKVLLKVEIIKKENINTGHIIQIEDGDLHHPGYWISKQVYGSFICEECGKEFAHYTTTPREKARKYCKECALKIKNNTTSIRVYYCIDCGEEVRVPARNTKSCRCSECQEYYDLVSKKMWARKHKDDEKDIKEDNIKE